MSHLSSRSMSTRPFGWRDGKMSLQMALITLGLVVLGAVAALSFLKRRPTPASWLARARTKRPRPRPTESPEELPKLDPGNQQQMLARSDVYAMLHHFGGSRKNSNCKNISKYFKKSIKIIKRMGKIG